MWPLYFTLQQSYTLINKDNMNDYEELRQAYLVVLGALVITPVLFSIIEVVKSKFKF